MHRKRSRHSTLPTASAHPHVMANTEPLPATSTLATPSAQRECVVCFTSASSANVLFNFCTACQTATCPDCVCSYVQCAIQDVSMLPLRCPGFQCNLLLSSAQLTTFLPQDLSQAFAITRVRESQRCTMRRMEKLMQSLNSWHNHDALMSMPQPSTEEEWHNYDELMKLAAKKGWKSCPRCNVLIDRYTGCSYVTCRCGRSFSWNEVILRNAYTRRTPQQLQPAHVALNVSTSERAACAMRRMSKPRQSLNSWHNHDALMSMPQPSTEEEWHNYDELMKLAAQKGWKSCPRCNVLIDRYTGCSSMTCRCGKDFSWNEVTLRNAYTRRTPQQLQPAHVALNVSTGVRATSGIARGRRYASNLGARVGRTLPLVAQRMMQNGTIQPNSVMSGTHGHNSATEDSAKIVDHNVRSTVFIVKQRKE